jgi:hypothetical protein
LQRFFPSSTFGSLRAPSIGGRDDDGKDGPANGDGLPLLLLLLVQRWAAKAGHCDGAYCFKNISL